MKPRLLIVQPSLQPPGGGNSVAVWAVEALRGEYELSLLCWKEPDFDEINRYYGTSLTRADFAEIRTAPARWRLLIGLLPFRLAMLVRAIQSRMLRRIEKDFDGIATFNNEIDVGRHALQYIHFPWRYWPRPGVDMRWYHHIPGTLRFYFYVTNKLARFSRDRAAQNVTLVNSDWTGEKYRAEYSAGCITVYPPVFASPSPIPWSERANRFLAVGRISPEKNFDRIVRIIDAVRERGHAVELVIVGTRDYGRLSRALDRMMASRPWMTIQENIPRSQLLDLLARTRYGIHGMLEEHFGIAVAEMAMTGCIPFVPDGGGQVEIVGDARLTYRSIDDAASRICAVLDDPALQEELSAALIRRSAGYSYPNFARQIRASVRSVVRADARQ